MEAEETAKRRNAMGSHGVTGKCWSTWGVSRFSRIFSICQKSILSDPATYIRQDPNEQFEAIEELLRQCLACTWTVIFSNGIRIDAFDQNRIDNQIAQV